MPQPKLGAVHKVQYVTLFLANSDSLPLSHIVKHLGPPPLHFSRPSKKTEQKPLVQILSQLFTRVFVRGDTKNVISVTSHALYPLPLSQTVTPSRTPSPSSVTYFMEGPLHSNTRRYGKMKIMNACWHERIWVDFWVQLPPSVSAPAMKA